MFLFLCLCLSIPTHISRYITHPQMQACRKSFAPKFSSARYDTHGHQHGLNVVFSFFAIFDVTHILNENALFTLFCYLPSRFVCCGFELHFKLKRFVCTDAFKTESGQLLDLNVCESLIRPIKQCQIHPDA